MVGEISQFGGRAQSLFGVLQKKHEALLDGAEGTAVQTLRNFSSPAASESSASASMMAGNFTGATERSRYIEADLAGRQARQQMVLRSHQILQAAAAEMLAANGIDATQCASAAGASAEIKRISDAKNLEASKKNLDEMKEHIEQNAEEAAKPKDENGEPVETAGGAAPLPDVPASAAPEYSPAVPEAAATPPAASAVQDASQLAAAPQAPASESVNIVV